MKQYANRLLRAAKLDPQLYEEVESDKSATFQAGLTVVLVSLAAGFSEFNSGILGVLTHSLVAILGWILWAFLSFFIGTKLLPERQTQSNLGELLRCTGFAFTPGILQIFGLIPGLGPSLRVLTSIWMLAAFVIAVRQALDYNSTWRAFGVCLIGWLVLTAMNVLLWIISLGQFTL